LWIVPRAKRKVEAPAAFASFRNRVACVYPKMHIVYRIAHCVPLCDQFAEFLTACHPRAGGWRPASARGSSRDGHARRRAKARTPSSMRCRRCVKQVPPVVVSGGSGRLSYAFAEGRWGHRGRLPFSLGHLDSSSRPGLARLKSGGLGSVAFRDQPRRS